MGFFQDFEEIEERMLGVLDKVSSLQLLRCSITERDFIDIEIWDWWCRITRDAQR